MPDASSQPPKPVIRSLRRRSYQAIASPITHAPKVSNVSAASPPVPSVIGVLKRFPYQAIAAPLAGVGAPPETVTLDKWFQEPAQPLKYRLPSATAWSPAVTGRVSPPDVISNVEPCAPAFIHRRKPTYLHGRTLVGSFGYDLPTTFVWLAQYPDIIARRPHQAWRYPSLSWHPVTPAALEEITLDKWFQAVSEPVRRRVFAQWLAVPTRLPIEDWLVAFDSWQPSYPDFVRGAAPTTWRQGGEAYTSSLPQLEPEPGAWAPVYPVYVRGPQLNYWLIQSMWWHTETGADVIAEARRRWRHHLWTHSHTRRTR